MNNILKMIYMELIGELGAIPHLAFQNDIPLRGHSDSAGWNPWKSMQYLA